MQGVGAIRGLKGLSGGRLQQVYALPNVDQSGMADNPLTAYRGTSERRMGLEGRVVGLRI